METPVLGGTLKRGGLNVLHWYSFLPSGRSQVNQQAVVLGAKVTLHQSASPGVVEGETHPTRSEGSWSSQVPKNLRTWNV